MIFNCHNCYSNLLLISQNINVEYTYVPSSRTPKQTSATATNIPCHYPPLWSLHIPCHFHRPVSFHWAIVVCCLVEALTHACNGTWILCKRTHWNWTNHSLGSFNQAFLQWCMHLLRYDSHTFLGVFSVKLHVISPVDMFFQQWSKMSCANHGLVLSHMVGKCKHNKRSYTT